MHLVGATEASVPATSEELSLSQQIHQLTALLEEQTRKVTLLEVRLSKLLQDVPGGPKPTLSDSSDSDVFVHFPRADDEDNSVTLPYSERGVVPGEAPVRRADPPSQKPFKFPSLVLPSAGQNIVFFSGAYHPLSNLAAAVFFYKNSRFFCGEQAIQYIKAMTYGDCATATAILQCNDGPLCLQLGKRVSGFRDNPSLWYRIAPKVISEVATAKFQQNPRLLACLLATEDSYLAESTLGDVWGIGLRFNDPKRHDASQWVGRNLFGTILTNIRSVLKPRVPEEVVVDETPQASPQVDTTVLLGDSHVGRLATTASAGDNPQFVFNPHRGISISQLAGLTERLIQQKRLQPCSKLVLMVGSNDVACRRNPESVAGDMANLLRLLKTKLPQTSFTVVGIPLSSFFPANSVIKKANSMIRIVCELFHVTFLNPSEVFHENGKFLRGLHSRDMLHLTPMGYSKFYKFLRHNILSSHSHNPN